MLLHNSGDDTRDVQRLSELDLVKFPGYDKMEKIVNDYRDEARYIGI